MDQTGDIKYTQNLSTSTRAKPKIRYQVLCIFDNHSKSKVQPTGTITLNNFNKLITLSIISQSARVIHVAKQSLLRAGGQPAHGQPVSV